jgi:hypothetical protein
MKQFLVREAPITVGDPLSRYSHEQVPGFAVGFVVVLAGVASAAGRAVGIEPEPYFGLGEKNPGAGDEIPSLHGKNVNREEVEVFGAVVLIRSRAAAAKADEISAASLARRESLHLYAEEASGAVDDDIVLERVSMRLEDAESAGCGLRHEL